MYFLTSAGLSSICSSLRFYWLISFFCLFFNVSWISLRVLPSLQFLWSTSFSGLLVYVLFATLQFHWLISFFVYFSTSLSWMSFNVLQLCNSIGWSLSFVYFPTSVGFSLIYCSSAISLVDLFCLFSFNVSWISFNLLQLRNSIGWSFSFGLFFNQRQLDFLLFQPSLRFHWLTSFFFVYWISFYLLPSNSIGWSLCFVYFPTLDEYFQLCNSIGCRQLVSHPSQHFVYLVTKVTQQTNIDIPHFSRASSCPISCDLVHAHTCLATKLRQYKTRTNLVSCFWGRFNGQEMLLALNFDGKSTKEKIMNAVSTITYTK